GYGIGLLLESHLGRPTKAEGNPDHPASLGATNIFGQACVLDLYDPDRSNVLTQRGNVSDWGAFSDAMTPRIEQMRGRGGGGGGAGLRILTEAVTSPTLADQLQRLLKLYPAAKWHRFDPVSWDNAMEGAAAFYGRALNTIYRFDRAQVIVSLDSDFLFEDPASLVYARQFIDGRRVRDAGGTMNRLYVAEPTPTITGSMADHRQAVRASAIEGLAREVLQAVTGA